MSDAFDRADSAKPASPKFWGRVNVNAYDCILQKGVGKIPFNPTQHKAGEMRTAIDLTVTLLPETVRKADTLQRGMVAESAEWTRVTLPSLKALGYTGLRSLNGMWCAVEFAGLGTFYTDNQGESRERQAFKFTGLYATEAECRKAYQDETGETGMNRDLVQDVNAPAPVSDEKMMALTFVTALAKTAGGDKEKLAALIAQYPVVSKHFTVDSPEVAMLLAVPVAA